MPKNIIYSMKAALIVTVILLASSGCAVIEKTYNYEPTNNAGGSTMGTFEYKGIRIFWLGHSSFRIEKGENTIYIDPYAGEDYTKKATLVLVTHGHYDHCDMDKIRRITDEKTAIVLNEGCAGLKGASYISSGDIKTVGEIKITAVPAYNMAKPYHPKEKHGTGFIIDIEGARIYHAGDTDLIPEMSGIKDIDIALLPIGGTYTMDETEAAQAANTIRPKIAVPMHYNHIKGTEKDPEAFAGKVDGGIDVKIL